MMSGGALAGFAIVLPCARIGDGNEMTVVCGI